MNRAYLLSGLPGAGKSTAAEIGKTITNGDILRGGDMVREMAKMDGLEDPDSDELGQYAADSRKEYGPGFFAERAVGMLLRGEIEVGYPLFVDSVRNINGVTEFSEYFDSTVTLYIDARRDVRLERLQDRGREGEDSFSYADLARRDERELQELGTQTILDSGRVDHVIPNGASEAHLRERLEDIIHGWEP